MVSYKNSANAVYSTDSLPFEIKSQNSTDGKRLKIDFYEKNAQLKDSYDTTRLIISKEPLNYEGHIVYNCAVSWYGSDDRCILDPKTNQIDSPRAIDYKGVLMEIDPELLLKDPQYCDIVMRGLLNQGRVAKYLEQGLKENPQIACGNYIGGVEITENGYKKAFYGNVGRASHNSPIMIEKRQKHKKIMNIAQRMSEKEVQDGR